MQKIYVDIRNIEFGENIIDVCYEGNSIINELISFKFNDVEKNITNLNEIKKINTKYDSCIFFFTLSRGVNRFKFIKIIKALIKSLDKGSKIYIWDIVLSNQFFINYEVNVEGEFGIKKMPLKIIFKPFRLTFLDILRILENNGFKINNSVINNNVFYIEAEFIREEKLDKNEDSISSIKRKIRSFKPSYKIFKKGNRRL
ncbi:hypothetical protein [Thermobrachium celere]|uniref:Uncharacterized protein n=2 Tax=Thermobrachium TaxID=150333 RepID=R7RT63_9CLOT|nr:hypothetical protein [Thermobrachium celere]CDF58556.1 hypothetical protein TCEL_00602 [Thermobrachium celere DSM 8682]